ncbi:Ger(x)C family spore germination C-terminal domain-containing protein [Cohnella sp. REN36]|uniref:Ger(x)C family spore germination protein n=1 Tax=Cohnella sp. REN36 TaxID=2887347 RepID=UPI001D13809F|nr:Ger(x)C family spore germination C-terminal domain-containing protein [Cohnella sp. REN36]MCC3375715.1 hypothetical protein [Cohnella sp. REN36]
MKRAGIRLLLLASFSWSLLPLGGCQLKDIDKRFFVVSAGFDVADNPAKPYRVTLRLALTSSKLEAGASHTQVETMDAASVAEAVRHLKANVDKELEFGHCREFVFGREMLEQKGFQEVMEWLARRRDIQGVSNVMIGDPDASSILETKPLSERYPGNALFLTFGNEGTEASDTVTEYLFDLYRREYETGLDPVLPVVRSVQHAYQINRVALLDKEKIRLILSPEETQIYNMTANDIRKSVLAMPTAEGRLVMAVTKVRSRVSVADGGIPKVVLHVRATGFLEQSPPRLLERDWDGLERKLGRYFSEKTVELLEKIRDQNIDPYGFGLHYLANHYGRPSTWEKWKELYPRVKFEVRTDVKIQGTGLIR